MTAPLATESAFERIVSILILVAFWSAFICLGSGLATWLAVPGAAIALELLESGLLGLLALPLLRLVAAVASASRNRDWMTVAATLAVLGILFALTLRDAAGLR
jgi:uncharacterized membrane protein